MRNKRKASPTPRHISSPRNKRARYHRYAVVSSDEEDISADEREVASDEEYEINGILDETESHYLIDWVGNYSPSWEPKENASPEAIQAWEEKKREQEQPAAEGSGVSTGQSSTQSPRSIPDECAETPAQETVPPRPSDSPLFVPHEAGLETQLREINEPPLSSLPVGGSSQSLVDPKSPTKPQHQSVFDSFPRASIPREYLLPGESGEPPIQNDGSIVTELHRGTEDHIAEEIGEDSGSSRERQNTIVQPSPRTEIPETPSIPFIVPHSQLLPAGTQVGTLGSQLYLNSASSSSILASTLPARTSPVNWDSLRSNLSSVFANTTPNYPSGYSRTHLLESASANTSTSQPFTTPAARAVADSTGISSIASPSQASLLNTLFIPREFPILSRNKPGNTARGLSPNAPSLRPLATQSPSTPARMDDQSQKKPGSSLAETMEKYSHIEGSTPQEKIMNLYARVREKSTIETLQNEASATPSSPGDIEASEPPPAPETVAPLSVRVDKEPPHVDAVRELVPETSLEETEAPTHISETVHTIHPSALTMDPIEKKVPGSVDLGPSEFAVTLPMDSRVKDDYGRVLQESKEVLGTVLSGLKNSSESELERAASSLQQVLERLSNVATHPDINVAEHMKDANSKLDEEAGWADYSSAKFHLLNYLTKAASAQDIHLVIMVRREKTQRIVERYLQGRGFSYTRAREEMGSGTNVEVSMAKGALSFGVQLAQSDGIVETYKAPSAIIALDSSLNTKNPSVEHMRTTFARNGHLLPVIRLMVANSSEHVELCCPGPPTTKHLSKILRCSGKLYDIVGELQDDALGVHEDADEIMASLLSENFNASWSLPLVEPLRQGTLDEPSQDGEHFDVEDTIPGTSVAQKRGFEEDSLEPTSKKARVDESQDISQVTVSSKAASQSLDSQIQFLEQSLIQMRAENATEIQNLRKEVAEARARLLERDRVLETLQHRYETRTKDLHTIRRERDRLLENKTNSEQRIKKQNEEIAKLKDERTLLKQELAQAREALKTGGGDMAELEKAREENRRLTTENTALERKADVASKQAEYTREQYQTASNAAAHSGNELRALREENEILKRKVAGEATRLRELNIKNDETRHLARIAELESLLTVREDILQRKEDELREMRKNRPSTRSTSTQPRSPKLNAGNYSRPGSPGINNNGSNFPPGRGSALRSVLM
ncbi:uncharacterized protein DSM5745_00430 [Aspergillus mulundensis]|uniref:Chromo domain-containing protein n=1 Tax=Aspergillus mulundensis TaxID=1810919 RepID=A0A3D8T520_9EURO|nr:Uncharacterized protein DSM5745_00430 [Aspergillus mulundensis]RDW93108.1 Uncharacterized protein DSM5745_00430 [Aspergillus mulundensis]